jgi:hypothetical protein
MSRPTTTPWHAKPRRGTRKVALRIARPRIASTASISRPGRRLHRRR